MNITRRNFGKGALATAVAVAAVGATSCSWESDLESVLPGILAAIASIASVLQSAGITLTQSAKSTLADIATGGADILALLQQWTPTAGNAAQIVAEIDTLLTAFLSSFQNLLGLLPPLPATIIGIVGAIAEIVLSTIEGYLNKSAMSLPKAQAKLQQAKLAVAGKTKTASTPPNARSGHAFVKDMRATGWYKLVH